MKQPTKTLLVLLVILGTLIPRLAALVKFTAADEPFWLVVGANYYYALTHRELENTVYEYHPAVTTMWIGTAAMLIDFPEYRAIMDGYIHQEKTLFDTYLTEHGKDPLDLLWWCRFIQVLVNLTLFGIAFFLLRHLFDEWIALMVLLLSSFSPYLFGQSRMLNHESMVGLFSTIAILAVTAYLFKERRFFLLFLSGGAAAFANLTKSSAIVLLPVTVCILLAWGVTLWREGKRGWSVPGNALKILLLWLAAFAFVYVAVWPGMWVAPGKMLYEVYGNAFSYAFQGARLSITNEVTPSGFDLIQAGRDLVFFLNSIVWRTTPITWIGLVAAIVLLFSRKENVMPPLARLTVAFLFLEAVAVVSMFSLISGRNQPHYILAAYYGLEFSAALGWAYILRRLAMSQGWARRTAAQTTMFILVLLVQASGLFYTSPYYYTYLNPVLSLFDKEQAPRFLYGERMETAAAYLAQKPDAKNLTALVYFGRSFSYYFPGRTLLLGPNLFRDKEQLKASLRESDYLVIYAGQHDRLPILNEVKPETIIQLNGMDYVEIYRVSDIPESFYKE